MDKLYFLPVFISLSIVVSTFGQTDSLNINSNQDSIAPINDRLEFPMKDLINMKVTVASKKEEKISDAPSTITAYSSKDVEQLGYYTLADLAGITSGYSVNYQFGESGFETRGQTASGFNNNKHLLILDGIPVNFARSYKAQIQEEFPLFFAQRIEFLKGPASALYGVSAFYGAVNVVSKDAVSNGTVAESKISGGNWNNNFRLMSNIFHRSNNGNTSLNVGFFNKRASGDYVGATQNPDYRYWDKNTSLFIRSSHSFTNGKANGLSLGVIYMQRTGGLGESWQTTSTQVNNIIWHTLIPYVKYQRQLSRKLVWNSYAKGNNSIEDGQFKLTDKEIDSTQAVKGLSIYKSNVLNAEFLSELRYEWNTRNSFIVGVNYDWRFERGNPGSYAYFPTAPADSGQGFTFPLAWDFTKKSFYFNTVSGYTQYQKQIGFLSGLTITGGMRFDMGIIDKFNYSQLSPRVAVVQKITPQLNIKMMTGRALRAPGIKELGLTSQFLEELNRKAPDSIPNLPPIRPEVIQTYEAGITYHTVRMRVSVTGFYNETDDEMRLTTLKVPNGNDTLRGNWIENIAGTNTSRGVEADIMYAITKEIKVFSNYTYAVAKDQMQNYFASIPVSRINGGIVCALSGNYKMKSSLVVSHIDGYLTGGKTQDFEKSSTFVDANLIFPLGENIQAEVLVRNIFNQKVQFPSGIPLRGRMVQFTLATNFR